MHFYYFIFCIVMFSSIHRTPRLSLLSGHEKDSNCGGCKEAQSKQHSWINY